MTTGAQSHARIPQRRSNVGHRALAGFVNLFVVVAVALFVSAGTLSDWEAWLYLASFFVPSLLITIYFLKHDPDLIERRLKAGPAAERRRGQKAIQALASSLFVTLMIVPGLEHRFHWSSSRVPKVLVIAADGLVLAGFAIVFSVFRENTFTSAAIEVADEQKVVSTGPYSVVRHPMYSGALLLVFSTPLALGSWWGLPVAAAMLAVIVLRLRDEERFLRERLPGYDAYCRAVRYRLIPRVW